MPLKISFQRSYYFFEGMAQKTDCVWGQVFLRAWLKKTDCVWGQVGLG